MAVWEGLGHSAGGSYNGWSDYTEAVANIEDLKWVPFFADAFPRMRCVSSYHANGNLEDTVYPNISSTTLHRWVLKVKAHRPDIYILYGHAGNQGTITGYPEYSQYKPSGYLRQRAYMLQEAQWAQDNEMDAFCINNECLIGAAHINVGMIPTTLIRASNVATATFPYDHGLTTGDYIFVAGGTDATFRVADSYNDETVQCTVTGDRAITYPSTGDDGDATGSYRVNWSGLEKVRKIKADAVAAQAIFTRGPVVYSESQGHSAPWILLGITPGTDVDLYGHNGYGSTGEATTTGYNSWKTEVDTIWAEFGENMIVTELNCVLDGAPLGTVEGLDCEDRGFEVVHAKEVKRRVDYLRSLGMEQVYYFGSQQGQMFYNTWPSRSFGSRYLKGDYRPVYNVLREERGNRVFLGSGQFDPAGTPYWG